jgi:pyruvate/2-oxoglutarate dehydrogenase complex dihydrolipoamide dehydrogenase (E3) component
MLDDDPFDRALLDHVRPADWKNPVPTGRYNLVVIGAGTAGLVTAAGAAGLGARVALVERAELGGDCLNVGCVPSKALLRSAHAAAETRAAAALGVRGASTATVDFEAVMRRMRAVRARIAPNDSVARFTGELGVDVFLGEAHFAGGDEVAVGETRLRFKRAVIATGARPFVPPIPGLDDTGHLTNESVFDLRTLPRRLLVLGGGPIGCELAQAFRRFGSEVTLVEMADRFLEREDPDAAGLLLDALRHDGVDVRLSTRLIRVERHGEHDRRAFVEHAAREEAIPFDEILIAVGRSPNVDGLGLDAVGVEHDPQRGVHVDDHLRTRNPAIYAAGDVCMAHKFTHAADFAARAVIQNALFAVGPFGRRRLSALTIPWCTYTDPEIAHVGVSEQEAHHRGLALDTYTAPLSDVDRAIAEGRETGFVKLHAEKGRDRILGATIVGHGAGDLISEVSVAMAGGVGLGALSSVIHPYPTTADAIRQAAHGYTRSRLTPRVKRLFERWLAWRR